MERLWIEALPPSLNAGFEAPIRFPRPHHREEAAVGMTGVPGDFLFSGLTLPWCLTADGVLPVVRSADLSTLRGALLRGVAVPGRYTPLWVVNAWVFLGRVRQKTRRTFLAREVRVLVPRRQAFSSASTQIFKAIQPLLLRAIRFRGMGNPLLTTPEVHRLRNIQMCTRATTQDSAVPLS